MKKIKIIGNDNVGWSIDKDNSNLTRFLSEIDEYRITDSYLFADIYFFVWHDLVLNPRYIYVRVLRTLSALYGKRKKIIAWITNDVSQSETFLRKKWPVDLWVSPSSLISDFLKKHLFPHVTIPFYVDSSVFKKLPDTKIAIASTLGISADSIRDKVVIGSFQRDSSGSDLKAPKWQKNPDLLIRIVKQFPVDAYVLMLAGPRRHYMISRCKKEGIPFLFVGESSPINEGKDDIFINNMSEDVMNKLYNVSDLYIVTSSSEGGPKSILEGSLAGTLVCSTDVGLARDFLHEDLIYTEDRIELVARIFKNISHEKELDSKMHAYIDHNRALVMSSLEHGKYLSMIRNALTLLYVK